ncbi:MAG: deoxyribonuclease IV [Acidimicrobiia bacterium]|nr:deoxyribonuclease IV [Acidimicrobiia bacterium]
MRIGGHVSPSDPLGTADAEGAECVQLFLGNPQSWKAPKPRDDVDELRSAELPIYVHAPYLVNVASPNNKVRIPSRKILQQTCDAATEIGAEAVVVHGGHITAEDEPEDGFARWVKALERLESEVPVLLENTAGGDHAMARHFDTIAGLWDHIGDLGIGFCLDTCHAHAAGEEMISAAERILAITGRIRPSGPLQRLEGRGTRDPGRDRHEHLGFGEVEPEALVETVRVADAPVICETGDDGRKDDIAWLRERV